MLKNHGLSGCKSHILPISYSRHFSKENVSFTLLDADYKLQAEESGNGFKRILHPLGTCGTTYPLLPWLRFKETTGLQCVDYAITKRRSFLQNSHQLCDRDISSLYPQTKSMLKTNSSLQGRQKRVETERRCTKHQSITLKYQDVDEGDEIQRRKIIKLWMQFFG